MQKHLKINLSPNNIMGKKIKFKQKINLEPASAASGLTQDIHMVKYSLIKKSYFKVKFSKNIDSFFTFKFRYFVRIS